LMRENISFDQLRWTTLVQLQDGNIAVATRRRPHSTFVCRCERISQQDQLDTVAAARIFYRTVIRCRNHGETCGLKNSFPNIRKPRVARYDQNLSFAEHISNGWGILELRNCGDTTTPAAMPGIATPQ